MCIILTADAVVMEVDRITVVVMAAIMKTIFMVAEGMVTVVVTDRNDNGGLVSR